MIVSLIRKIFLHKIQPSLTLFMKVYGCLTTIERLILLKLMLVYLKLVIHITLLGVYNGVWS